MNEDLTVLAMLAAFLIAWLQLVITDVAIASATREREMQFLVDSIPRSDHWKRL
jgi:hypothetical protein